MRDCNPTTCLSCRQGRDCPRRLHTSDGGHQVDGAVSVRLEPTDDLTDRDRVLIGSAGAALVALAAAMAHALGFPIILLF